MSQSSQVDAFHASSPSPQMSSGDEFDYGTCETNSIPVYIRSQSVIRRKQPDCQIYSTNLLTMKLEEPPDDPLNGNISDIAKYNIEPYFDIDLDSAEESFGNESKNLLIISLELMGRAEESYQDVKVQVITSIRNTQHNQKCCVYDKTIPVNQKCVRYEACVGYSYEIMEFFKRDGAVVECEVCFRLPIPENCVKL